MEKIMRLEFSENEYIDIELNAADSSDGRGLGGVQGTKTITKSVFDKSLATMVSMLRETSRKVSENVKIKNLDTVSITVGASFGVEGNFLLAKSTSEANLALTITIKGNT